MKKTNVIVAVLALVFVCQSAIFAQGSFMSTSSIAPSNLSNAEQKRLQEIENSPNTSTTQLVTMGDIANIVDDNGSFTFNVPGFSNPYTAQAKVVEAKSSTDFTWMGDVYNYAGGMEGSMVLYSEDGEVSGTFDLIDNSYELTPLYHGLSILSKIEPDLNQVECSTPSFLGGEGPPPAGDRTDNCVVRILVFYSPSVIVNNFNVSALANAAIAQVNQALINSGINQLDLKVQLAGLLPNPTSYSVTGDMEADLASFRNNTDVQALRGQYYADMVVQLSNNILYDFAGITNLGPNFSRAYAIVQRDNATATKTFAHEVGHMFGCNHQQCSITQTAECTPDVGYNHGYKYTVEIIIHLHEDVRRTYSTILHVLTASAPRQLRYSNPNISQSGVPTGIANSNDNARVIRENGCTVANFEATPLVANITGPYWGEPNQSVTLGSTVSGGTPPYQYEWKMGTNPMNYNTSLGNGTSATFTVIYQSHYIRLKVSSADGQVVYAYRTVNRFNHKPTSGNTSAPSFVENNDIAIESIAPNPSNVSTIVEVNVNFSTNIKIDVINSLGEVISLSQNNYFEKGEYSLAFDTGQLPVGNYYIRLKTSNATLLEKLVVLR